jgi:hypothetical protein
MSQSFRKFGLTVALVLLTALGMVLAQQPPAKSQEQLLGEHQVELTPGTIEAFLATYPPIKELGQEFERQYGHADIDPEDPASFAMAYARYAEAREQMEQVLADHGIGSMEEWAQIAYSLMIAYSFAESGENIGGMHQEMAETIEQIRGDASIPAAQREQLVAMLEKQLGQLNQLRPPDGNIELAAQYADRIREIVDDEDAP